MESYQKELALIKTILKDNPKGMTVSDISREIDLNRNSVAKYLDILLISGQAEMITFGPAKVYFPSRRVPITAVLNFVSDYILILDGSLKITQINNAFLEFLKVQREEITGQFLENISPPLLNSPDLVEKLKKSLDGKEFSEELVLKAERITYYFKTRLLPTTFEDGGTGVTIILTNITERKRIEHALRGEKK